MGDNSRHEKIWVRYLLMAYKISTYNAIGVKKCNEKMEGSMDRWMDKAKLL